MQPRLTVSETWSDNIELSSTDEEHEFVTRIAPGVSLVREGSGRFNLNLDYQLGFVHYARGTDGNGVDHRLAAAGDAELVRQRVFLDFNATAGQRNISSFGTLSSDNVNVTDNREDFFTFDVSPYLAHHFGNYADGELRYRHARVFNSESSDFDVNEVSATLTSGRRFAALPWSLNASWRHESDSDDPDDSEFRVVEGSVGYSFTRRYAVRLTGGYEDDDFQSATGDTSGVIWRVTGIWTPSARTNVEIGYGGRYFGNFPTVNVTHRMRRAVFTASYLEEVTTSSTRQLETSPFPTTDAFGNEIVNPGLAPTRVPIDDPSVTSEVFRTRRFDGGLAFRGRRMTSSLNGYYEKRDFQLSLDDEKVIGVTGIVTHSLSSTMSASVRGGWQRSEFELDNREDDRWSLNLSLSRQFHPDINGTLTYGHLKNDSSDSTREYKENRVDARVTVLF